MATKQILLSGKSKTGKPIDYLLTDPKDFYYSYPFFTRKVKEVVKEYEEELGWRSNLVAVIANFTVSLSYSHNSGSFYSPSILYWDGSSVREFSGGNLELVASQGFKRSMNSNKVYFYINDSSLFDWSKRKTIRRNWLPMINPKDVDISAMAFSYLFDGFYNDGAFKSIMNSTVHDIFFNHLYDISFKYQIKKIKQEGKATDRQVEFLYSYPFNQSPSDYEKQKLSYKRADFMVNELKKEGFFPSLVDQLDTLFSKVDGLNLKSYTKEGKSEFYFPLSDGSQDLRLVVFIFPALIVYGDSDKTSREIAYLGFSSASLLLVEKPEKYLQFGEGKFSVGVEKGDLEAWGKSKGVPKRTIEWISKYLKKDTFRFVVFPKDKVEEITGGQGRAVIEFGEKVTLEKVPKPNPKSKKNEEERKEIEEVELYLREHINGLEFSISSKVAKQIGEEIHSEEGSDIEAFYSAMGKAKELTKELGEGEEGEEILVSPSAVGELCIPVPESSGGSKLRLLALLKRPAYLLQSVAKEELMKKYQRVSEYDFTYKYCKSLTECFLSELLARDLASFLDYLSNGGGKVSLTISNQIYVWEDKGGEKTFSRLPYFEAIIPIEEYDNLVISLSIGFPL